MRATQYADGVKRINAKIEVPLSATDVGDYILCAIKHQNINLNKWNIEKIYKIYKI